MFILPEVGSTAMKLWVWRPGMDALDDLQRHMSRLMDWTLNVVGQQFSQSWQPLPSCNVYESETEYQFLMPMPGVRSQELDVQVAGSQLVIKGERKRPEQINDEQYRRQERWMGRWTAFCTRPQRESISPLTSSTCAILTGPSR